MMTDARIAELVDVCAGFAMENVVLKGELATARNDTLEEAAKWCDFYSTEYGAGMFDVHSTACAKGIRALKTKEKSNG